MQALLIQPPMGDITGPYPALPYLKAFAQQRGHQVQTRDLGIEALYYFARHDRLHDLFSRIEELCQGLEAKVQLTPAQREHYAMLLGSLGLALQPELVGEALQFFRDGERFFDYEQYKKAARTLNSLFQALSAAHFPTRITPAEYPPARDLGSFPAIQGHQNSALNPFAEFYEETLLTQVAQSRPQLVGISMVFASQSVQALVLAGLLKKHFPEIHITLGGAYLSQWVLLMGPEQLSALFQVSDSVICGEGEEPLAELLDRLEAGRGLAGAPNLIYRDVQTGRPARFMEMQYINVASQPPPDYSDFLANRYLSPKLVIPYCISRGCYWGRCAFCQSRYGDENPRRYQTVPVEKALAEMEALAKECGSEHFNFSNDAIDPAYLKRFSRALLAEGKRFVWNTDLRAEKAFDAQLCKQLAQAGLNSVAIGFESGCQKVLDAMDKGNRVEVTRRVFKNFYEAGVATQAMGFFGFPGESEKDGEETVKFLEDNLEHISYYVLGLLMVLPGARLYNQPAKYGIDFISYEGNALLTPEPVWSSRQRMPREAVQRLYQRLSSLERIFAINDYPFVGGLSTNHGFLYFRGGPDILKRLRQGEMERHLRQHAVLGLDRAHQATGKLKGNLVPRLRGPYALRRSPFLLPQGGMEPGQVPPLLPRVPGIDYLVAPLIPPFALGLEQKQFLERIDGQTNLRAVMGSKQDGSQRLFFLMSLLSAGMVEINEDSRV
jgi:anaerobic magnesium-protoporphyrin IX monomethyl ester cyclase